MTPLSAAKETRLTPLQALWQLHHRWTAAANAMILTKIKAPEAQQYIKDLKACAAELMLTLEGVQEGQLVEEEPQPHETGKKEVVQ